MKIVLATSNRGKVKEIKKFFKNFQIIPYTDLIDQFEIEESGKTFKDNAIIKAVAVSKALKKKGFNEIVIADDSGISVEALNWQPNIFSARYAGVGSSSKDNLEKMISELIKSGVESSKAFYTASIAIVDKEGEIQTTHGWMYGKVIPRIVGDGGFGYDPIFVPDGEKDTLGVLDTEIKEKFSHRTKALKLAKTILDKLK